MKSMLAFVRVIVSLIKYLSLSTKRALEGDDYIAMAGR